MEIELKLALDPTDAARLKRHPLLAGIKAERQTLHSIYFDTPEFALTGRRIAFRLRRVGYHWVQTVKAAAPSVGALSSRPEWEAQVMDNTPDLTVLAPEALALLDGIDPGRLAPVFVTDIRRTTWQTAAGGTVMEIALDQGEIRAGEAASPVSEIELELKSGAPDGLFDAALGLLERVPLRVDSRSKSAIGFRLAGAVKAAPAKAVWPRLDPAQAAGTAWTALVEAALAQLTDNLPGFLEQPEELEYLHQLRVALRRLMSLARLLTKSDPPWLSPLREHMAVLNPARDWDVFLRETLPRLDFPHDAAFLAHAEAMAAAARQAAQADLASPAFTRVVLQLGRALLTPPDTSPSASEWAAGVLEQRWKDVRRRGKALAGGKPDGKDAAALHRLRIAVKKLRYASDALANLYGKRCKKSLAGLATLQDSLGALNDLAVAGRLMHALATAHPEIAFCAGHVVGLLSADAKQQVGSKQRIKRELAAIKPFWRKS
jgi:triphosphatase